MISGNTGRSGDSAEVKRVANVLMSRKVMLAAYRTDRKLAGHNSQGLGWG